ncbi:MAG: nitroreductase family protein [Phycisphaerae bacterium]|nr:nitroreductase family protein [Phycisphaerae bacterium]
MELFEAIEKRHSYRGGFTDEAVNKEDLKRIVSTGLAAPSGCNAQTTRFVIVDDPAMLAKICAMHTTNIAMQQAKAMIICIVDKEPQPVYEDKSFAIEDCAAAVENMLLAITALGYASVWIDGWLRVEGRADKIAKLLGVPDGKIARVLLPIGRPAEKVTAREKMPFEKRAWFNQYSRKS